MAVPVASFSRLLAEHLRPQKVRVAALGAAILLQIALRLANPQFIRLFVDHAAAGDPLSVLVMIAVGFIAVMVLQQAVSVAAVYASELVGWTATNGLREKLLKHVVALDLGFHNRHTPGELIERIDGDVGTLGNFFSQFLLQIAANVVFLVCTVAFIAREDWRAGAAIAAFLVFAFLVVLRFRNVAVPHWKESRAASAAFFGFLEERLGGTEDIRSCGAKGFVLRRFFELLRVWKTKDQKGALMTLLMVNTSRLLFTSGVVLSLVTGALLYRSGAVTLGVVFLMVQYMNLLREPVTRIVNEIDNLQRASASVERCAEIESTVSSICDRGAACLPSGPLCVSFTNVDFAYDASDGDVLHDVSFAVAAGQTVGLLGRTGSGKSTIAKLLFRFHEADRGLIRIGGVPIADARLAELRRSIGLVTQNVQLFAASIRDNITLFSPEIEESRIVDTIEALGLAPWLALLQNGLDTHIRSDGLSAGEAQLLAFARIFLLKNPGIVVLDEASSRLDPTTERLLDTAVTRLIQGRTAIVIAHRLATVARMDRIIVMDDGRVVEDGERSVLRRDASSWYRRLIEAGDLSPVGSGR